MKLHIITTAFNRTADLNRLVLDFILQTNPDWQMRIIHDGPPPEGMAKTIKALKDPRVEFDYTKVVNGYWGHPNRRMMLEETEGEPGDYLLITNDDNQYVKAFWEIFAKHAGPTIGFMFCNMLHNYSWCGHYSVVDTKIDIGKIDMGSFVVRLDIAKAVGFNSIVEVADGIYAMECAAEARRRGLRIVKIDKPLFIHN